MWKLLSFVKMAGSLQNRLNSLLLDNVEETGKELGRGAYGVVVEVKWFVLERVYMKLLCRYIFILANDEMTTIYILLSLCRMKH